MTPQRYAVPSGIELVADVGGDPSSPTVMLLHGGGQTRHSWGGAMAHLLRNGYHVINLDARGHGDSGWAPDGDYSIAAMADDLRAVIATLRTPPALVGASLGGAAALYAVGTTGRAEQASFAKALVMVDIVPQLERGGTDKIADFMAARPEGFATLEEVADVVAAYYPQRARPKDPSGLMKNLRRRDDGRLYWHWDPAFLARPHARDPGLLTKLLQGAADHLGIPALLVRGMHSDVVSDEGVADFRHRTPGLEVFDVANAGHMVAGDRNDAFNHAVIEFLQRHLPIA